jgi:hypothetical protein
MAGTVKLCVPELAPVGMLTGGGELVGCAGAEEVAAPEG